MIYVPAFGPVPARTMLVGEAPGGDEESHTTQGRPDPRPFVGLSGQLLDRCLVTAGINRDACFITNVCKFRPPKNKIEEWCTEVKVKAERNGLNHHSNGRWYNDYVAQGITELLQDIERVRPEVIVAFGNVPLWALTGQWGITSWRGSELWYGEDTRLIPTLHPSYILRAMEYKPALVHDLRVRVVGKQSHREDGREPKWRFETGTNFERVCASLVRIREARPEWLSVDVETKRGRIDCCGFAWSTRDALCVPMIDTEGHEVWNEPELREVSGLMKAILTDSRIRVIGQNFNYDASYFYRDPAFGYVVVCAHDSKVAQHCLLPGTDKDLVTLSAFYCDWHCYWKDDLKESSETLDNEKRWRYNCRDCVVTYEVAMKQIPVLKAKGFL